MFDYNFLTSTEMSTEKMNLSLAESILKSLTYHCNCHLTLIKKNSPDWGSDLFLTMLLHLIWYQWKNPDKGFVHQMTKANEAIGKVKMTK